MQLGHHLKTTVEPGEGGGCPADEDGDEFAGAKGAGVLEAGCRGEDGGDGVVAGVGVAGAGVPRTSGGDDAVDGSVDGISGGVAGSSGGEASCINSSGTGKGWSDGGAG